MLVPRITDRKSAQRELAETQKKLIETARHIGMAEVATNVLHNVGNEAIHDDYRETGCLA